MKPEDPTELPADLHVHVEHQVWARVDEAAATARVGITALGIRLAGGEIYMCRPRPAGSEVAQGRSVAVVELAKSIVSVKSPVSGEVVRINEALGERPELVHTDPYGAGWIAELRLADWAGDRTALLAAADAREAMRHHAWLHREDAGDA
jgi:glycine cleavage system H protein